MKDKNTNAFSSDAWIIDVVHLYYPSGEDFDNAASNYMAKSVAHTILSWRDVLLQYAGEVCKECVDPRRDKEKLDFNNPLNGSCRCHRVEAPLSRAEIIDKLR